MKKSIVVDYDNICAICGRPKESQHHLIFGNSQRKLADEDGLTMPTCNRCHNMAVFRTEQIHDNPMAESLSKALGEFAWERYEIAKELAETKNKLNEFMGNDKRTTPERIIDLTQTKFMARYGRSYL